VQQQAKNNRGAGFKKELANLVATKEAVVSQKTEPPPVLNISPVEDFKRRSRRKDKRNASGRPDKLKKKSKRKSRDKKVPDPSKKAFLTMEHAGPNNLCPQPDRNVPEQSKAKIVVHSNADTPNPFASPTPNTLQQSSSPSPFVAFQRPRIPQPLWPYQYPYPVPATYMPPSSLPAHPSMMYYQAGQVQSFQWFGGNYVPFPPGSLYPPPSSQ
jgi:hypothetical protein